MYKTHTGSYSSHSCHFETKRHVPPAQINSKNAIMSIPSFSFHLYNVDACPSQSSIMTDVHIEQKSVYDDISHNWEHVAVDSAK